MAETASPEAAVPEKGEETPAAPSNDVDALVKELDRLLSKENLSSDPQISAALNPQLCVPVSTILQLKSVAAITDSLELVCEAADKSVNVGLSEDRTMVRPLLKSKRNTMIIRELEATEAEIRELLVGSPGEDEVVAVRPEVNDTWFVEFKTEEKTQETALWLRGKKFKDEPVKVSIKSEHFLRSFIPAQQAVAPSIDRSPGPMAGIPPFMPGGKPGLPFVPPMMPGKGAPPAMPGLLPWMFPYKGGMPFPNVPGLSSQVVAAAAANVAAAAAAKGAAKGQFAARAPMVRQSAEERATASASLLELLGGGQFRKDGKGGAEPNGVAGAGKKQKQKQKTVQKQVPVVDPAAFAAEFAAANAPFAAANAPAVPPSPPKPEKSTVLAQMSQLLGVAPQAPEPTVYQFLPGTSTAAPGAASAWPLGRFRHYSKEEISKICSTVTEIAKPDSYALLSKSQIILDPPNGKFEEAQNWDEIPAASPAPKKRVVKKQSKDKGEESKNQPEKEWKQWFATGNKSGPEGYTPEDWAKWEASESKKAKPKGAGKAASAAKKEKVEPAMKWVKK
jgi:hypothetical protein